jgi:hypothetical protein
MLSSCAFLYPQTYLLYLSTTARSHQPHHVENPNTEASASLELLVTGNLVVR